MGKSLVFNYDKVTVWKENNELHIQLLENKELTNFEKYQIKDYLDTIYFNFFDKKQLNLILFKPFKLVFDIDATYLIYYVSKSNFVYFIEVNASKDGNINILNLTIYGRLQQRLRTKLKTSVNEENIDQIHHLCRTVISYDYVSHFYDIDSITFMNKIRKDFDFISDMIGTPITTLNSLFTQSFLNQRNLMLLISVN